MQQGRSNTFVEAMNGRCKTPSGPLVASMAFGERYRQMQVKPSMGMVGDAYDNTMVESFFASLEGELVKRSTFQSKAQARMAVFTWIEGCPPAPS